MHNILVGYQHSYVKVIFAAFAVRRVYCVLFPCGVPSYHVVKYRALLSVVQCRAMSCNLLAWFSILINKAAYRKKTNTMKDCEFWFWFLQHVVKRRSNATSVKYSHYISCVVIITWCTLQIV